MIHAKKKYGQHFLIDKNIAKKIAGCLINKSSDYIIEIGPGEGSLTDFLLEYQNKLILIEIDKEPYEHLKEKYRNTKLKIINADFLKFNINELSGVNNFCIIGNFPYNISSQIFFKALENKTKIPEIVCMVQKEMAMRISSKHGNRTYGILSVLLQLYYKIEYLFTVNETVFRPQPKVKSGVIRLTKHRDEIQGVNEKELFKIVKLAFNQRRKQLRNSLKSVLNQKILSENEKLFQKRPEQLSPDEFVVLTKILSE